MKRLLYSAITLVMAILAGSCQREIVESGQTDGKVVFTVEIPAGLQTKSIADGTNVDQLIYEVWMTEDRAKTDLTDAVKLYQASTSLQLDGNVRCTTIELDLMNDQNFTILFWAQKNGTGAYDTDELTAVSYAKALDQYYSNDESLAAFYAAAYVVDGKHVDENNIPTTPLVTLRRPFAQLNLGTLNTSSSYDVAILESDVKISDVPTVFNVATKEASVLKSVSFKQASVPSDPSVLKVQDKDYDYVAMNYIFAGDNVTVEYNIYTKLDNKADATVNNVVKNVPLEENYRTNIVGNLLTSKVDYKIIVDADFKQPDIDLESVSDGLVLVNPDLDASASSDVRMYEISSENGFMYAMMEIVDNLAAGEEVAFYLLQSIDMATYDYVAPRVPAGAKVVLATGAAPVTRASAPIVISGLDGPIFSEVEGNATVTFSDIIVENYSGEGAALVGENNGTVIHADCSASDSADSDVELVGNSDGTGSTIDLEDGTVTGLEQLQAALRANSAEIKLAAPIVIEDGMTVMLDLNGNTVTSVDETEKNYSLFDNRGTLVVKNGTIKVSATVNSGWNRYSAAIANNPGGNLTVENAVIEHLGGTDMAYGIDNLTNGKGTYAVTVLDKATVRSTYRAVRQFLNGTEAVNELYVRSGSVLAGENKGVFFQDPSKHANTGKLIVEEGAVVGSVYLFVTEGSEEWPVEVSIASSSVDEGGVTYKNVPDGYDVVENNGVYSVVRSLTFDGVDTYKVYSAKGLLAVSSISLKGGEKVVLEADIDLTGIEFTGLGAFNPEDNNTFDGQNHAVSNWEYKGGSGDMGFIRNWVGPIRNLTIRNASIKTGGRSAVLAAKVYGNIDNCHLVDCSIEDSYWACGGIAGLYNSGSITNCTVDGCSIKSNGGTGGIVGVINETPGTREVKNCTVRNSIVNNTGLYGETYSGALVCGMIYISNSTVNFENCVLENNTKAGDFVGDIYYSAGDDVTVNVK